MSAKLARLGHVAQKADDAVSAFLSSRISSTIARHSRTVLVCSSSGGRRGSPEPRSERVGSFSSEWAHRRAATRANHRGSRCRHEGTALLDPSAITPTRANSPSRRGSMKDLFLVTDVDLERRRDRGKLCVIKWNQQKIHCKSNFCG